MNVAPRLDLVRTPSEQRSRHRKAFAKFFAPPRAAELPIEPEIPSPPPTIINITEPSLAALERRLSATDRDLADTKSQLSETKTQLVEVVAVLHRAFGPPYMTAEIAVPEQKIQRPAFDAIKKAVCKKYKITRLELESNRQSGAVARPRQVVMYLAKTMTLNSFPEIGRLLHRDHTTVLHGHHKIESLRPTDTNLDRLLKELEAELAPKDAPL